MHTILIAGGSGLIGTRLAMLLRNEGHQVRILTRSPQKPGEFAWQPDSRQFDAAAFDGITHLINLAGAGIADKRWTAERKKAIRDSRVLASETLADALRGNNHLPNAYIGASAIGYYGNTGDAWNRETDPPGSTGFMPPVCVEWEQSHQLVARLGVRTVVPRIGIVLDTNGGALPEMERSLPFGVGAYFADGQAWYSWIHLDDLCRFFLFVLENDHVEGVYNAVAPHPVRNIDFIKTLVKAKGQFAVPAPVPAFGLRILFGEMADVVLNSNRVAADKLMGTSFHFHFPELEQALRALYNK